MKDFLSIKDFSKKEILEILNLAIKIKEERKNGERKPYLDKKTLAMIFEKESTRTRLSFELGIYELGGKAVFLSSNNIQLSRGECIADTARVISSMTDIIMLRTFKQKRIKEFAKYSSVPVINGLTNKFHPVQILSDYMTIIENNLDKNLKVAYLGDANNISNSWMALAFKLGFELNIVSPKGYEVKTKIKKLFKTDNIKIVKDIKEALKGASVVTTDTWVSMGAEEEKEKRIRDFKGFTVNKALMALAKENAIFLHCLPAYRGYEVSKEVLEGKQSRVFAEAENRLHLQKGLMLWLLKNN